jgi:CheY-like chemotaxis protein
MSRTILLVDDDDDFIFQQKLLLTAKGYTVVTADSCKAAEAMLPECKPDAAVIDLMMEHMDSGFILAYRIKQRYPGVPVIMVTAVTGETGVEFAADLDKEKGWVKADTVMMKPVRGEQLIAEIERRLA